MKYYAILVAGGSGSRMNAPVPKQFLLINGRPVLMHTIEAFAHCAYSPEIIVVLPEAFIKHWENCCKEYSFAITHQVLAGGATRFQSVKNGLRQINEESVIAIHDAVRPVIATEIINHSFKVAEEKGNAVVAIKSRDSVRQMKGNHSVALNREHIYLVQTPQTFKSEILKRAYEQHFSEEFTDDASVVEKLGTEIELIKGNARNIKITFPEDIFIAEQFLAK